MFNIFEKFINIKNTDDYFSCEVFNSFKIFSFQKTSVERYLFYLLGIRFTITKHRLKEAEINRLNKNYEDNKEGVPKVKSSRETLDELLFSQKSISRFGDGEFNIIFGESIPFQKYSRELAERMKEILITDKENIMVAIPNIFSSLDCYKSGSAKFWRKYVVLHRERIYKLLDMQKQYYTSQVTRIYMGAKDKSSSRQYFDDFKKLWAGKDIVIVEGKASRLGYENDLFKNANSIKRILCPNKNAYDKYDEILKACLTLPKTTLFIIALGPTATVLSYDLSCIGYRALDIGHLDIEYEWMIRKATRKIPIENKYVNEIREGRKITTITDKTYLDEIIKEL